MDDHNNNNNNSNNNDSNNNLVNFGHQPEPVINKDQPSPLRCFFNALNRRKPLDCRTQTTLNRCLNLLDLTSLGVGSTLGLGLYVLTGQVASSKAGPAVVISFAMAALASAFSAICYAEFAGRVPKAGSAYAYSYICVGEFVAFIIGWNLVLEYVIGASSVAKGFSGYIYRVYDNIAAALSPERINAVGSTGRNIIEFNMNSSAIVTAAPAAISTTTTTTAATIVPLPPEPYIDSLLSYLASQFDLIAVIAILIVTIFIVFGVKSSTKITLGLTFLNLSVVTFVVVSGAGSLDLKYWNLDKSEVPKNAGNGGFMPFGVSGILAGSGSCFFGFVGFDTIASSAEEAKNPKRTVPISILLSLLISFLAYMSIAIVQTLLWPYYDQGRDTILPHIFQEIQMPVTCWVVLVGAIAGLSSSLLAGMYPLPRILYSMSHDKLIYSFLSKVDSRVKLPLRSVIIGSVLVAALCCVLDLEELADMMSIGTLFAYTLVSLSVLIIRYEDRKDTADDMTNLNNHLTVSDIIQDPNQTSEGSTIQAGASTWVAMVGDVDSSPAKAKLSAKQSTPIREKGSRALAPQLSIGFQSWFKTSQNDSHEDPIEEGDGETEADGAIESAGAQQEGTQESKWNIKRLVGMGNLDRSTPDDESSHLSKILISMLVILCIMLDVIVVILSRWSDSEEETKHTNAISQPQGYSFLEPKYLVFSCGCVVTIMLFTLTVLLSRLPTSKRPSADMFMVPWVPLIPILSVLVNVLLMLNLSYLTWMRFLVWMAVGLFIYFTYGIWNSEGFLLHLE